MTFEEWLSENKLDDEYFSRHDMYWFAEQAWIAAAKIYFCNRREREACELVNIPGEVSE